jgi:hypothetical protein
MFTIDADNDLPSQVGELPPAGSTLEVEIAETKGVASRHGFDL